MEKPGGGQGDSVDKASNYPPAPRIDYKYKGSLEEILGCLFIVMEFKVPLSLASRLRTLKLAASGCLFYSL